MKYLITTIVLDSTGFIEIDEAEYNRIKSAIANLFELLFFEENLDLVTENFQEYEAELLLIASREMIFFDSDYFTMSNSKNIVGRRIVNLLTTCTMYRDHSAHHFNNIYGTNSDISKLLEQEIKSQKENNFGYRVMEALRNYTQHRGFPIHSMEFKGEWLDIDNQETSRLMHTVIPWIKVTKLAEDEKFNKTVLKEMYSKEGKNGIDIRPLMREYIEGIGKIHEKLRDAIRSDVVLWENIINDVIERYKIEFGAEVSLAGLAIVAEDNSGKWIESRTIFKQFIEKRKALEIKNSVFAKLHMRYVSNEIRKKDT